MLSFILVFLGPLTVVQGFGLARPENSWAWSQFAAPYTVGFLAALFCVYIVPWRHSPSNPFLSQVMQRREAANKRFGVAVSDVDDEYGMEHLWLNADLQPQTSWVNMGYWKNAQSASQASADLFQELLNVSGIAQEERFAIVELGSACAETARFLMANYADACAGWTGLTLSKLQAHMAAQRLRITSHMYKCPDGRARFESFHTDASQPGLWSADLKQRLAGMKSPWLVAVDVLVHFGPSRQGTIAHMKKDYGVSLAVTDIIRKDTLSWAETLKLWFSLRLLDTPLENILTRSQYVKMLVECGYDESKIRFVVTTEHVCEPYSKFISEQGRRWQDLGGGKWDYNDFWLVGWVMKFWAKTALVDTCIIVARA